MTEAMDWSLWTWLLEKRRVRQIADRATDALDDADRKVKETWSDGLKRAYAELVEHERARKGTRQRNRVPQPAVVIGDSAVRSLARQLKEADDTAERARLAAERTFDEAERKLSTSRAREGARKALKTYDLREIAIRMSEAVAAELQDRCA